MSKFIESQAQELVVTFLHRFYSEALFTGGLAGENLHKGYIPRRGRVSPGARRKMMGYKAGTPDLLIFEPRKGSVGLAIEMKAPKAGVVSPEQRAFLEALRARNWSTAVCHGSAEAKTVIIAYFSEDKK